MSEAIEELWLPQALSINVPYELFWKLTPRRLKPFMKAEKKKFDERNREMWIQGEYLLSAIHACFSDDKYLSEPIDFTPKSIEEQVEEADLKFRQYAIAKNESKNRVP